MEIEAAAQRRTSAPGRTLPVTSFFREGKKLEVQLFRHPGVPLPSRLRVADGMTLVGDGGVIVAPPFLPGSVRSSIRWGATPEMAELAGLPEWMLRALGIDTRGVGRSCAGSEGGSAAVSLHAVRSGDHELARLFCDGADASSKATHGPEWIAKPWVAAGSLTVLTGPPKLAGKTTWLLNLVRSAVSGSRFLYTSCDPTPVVYLTEQMPHSFAAALRECGLSDPDHASRLSVLYRQQVLDRSWAEIVRLSVQQCRARGARMLVVDAIDSFASLSADAWELSRPEILDPLLEAQAEGLAVVIVYPQRTVSGELSEDITSFGKLGSAADVVLSLRRTEEGRGNLRRLQALSRFAETPPMTYLALIGGRYQPVEQPYGALFSPQSAPTLFSEAPLSALRAANA